MAKSIIKTVLDELNVSYTSNHLNNLFDNHPYRYTLYGIKSMLKHYSIDSVAIYIKDYTQLKSFKDAIPFVVQLGNDLSVVSKIDSETIDVITYGKHRKISYQTFSDLWTGVALIPLSYQRATEPDFHTNRINQIWNRCEYLFVGIFLTALTAYFGDQSKFFDNIWLVIQLGLSVCGLIFSVLLFLDFLKIENTIGKRICTSIKGHSCRNLLELSAAKFIGRYSWSEIGIAYFLSNILLILACPQEAYNIIQILTIFAVAYPFWSIWYQKYRAKNWCSLCLLTQGVIIGQFIATICAFNLQLYPGVSLIRYALAFLSYLLCGLIIHICVRYYISFQKSLSQIKALTLIKYKDETFNTLLTAQPKTVGYISSIFFGPENAKHQISVYVNPLCSPCVKTHSKIKELHKAGCQVRYYFTSFNDEVAPITHKLISYYFSHSKNEAWALLNKWYSGGYLYGDHFLDDYNIQITPESIREAYAHANWAKDNHLEGTPTIIFNNHHLPKEYTIDDVIYYAKFNS